MEKVIVLLIVGWMSMVNSLAAIGQNTDPIYLKFDEEEISEVMPEVDSVSHIEIEVSSVTPAPQLIKARWGELAPFLKRIVKELSLGKSRQISDISYVYEISELPSQCQIIWLLMSKRDENGEIHYALSSKNPIDGTVLTPECEIFYDTGDINSPSSLSRKIPRRK